MELLRHIFYIAGYRTRRWFSSRLVRLAMDRRGVTALVFAMSATAMLGVVGLATEVGTWYLARTQAYNVADAAAIAGALAAAGNPGSAEDAANAIVIANSYTAGAVTVRTPPQNGNFTSNLRATEVLVTINFQPALARFFTKQTLTVTARAVAAVQPVGTACALSLVGNLTISQNQAGAYGTFCYYASNATDTQAVIIENGSTLNVFGITTPGDCANCPTIANVPAAGQSVLTSGWDTSQNNYMNRPNASYQQPTTLDPAYRVINNLVKLDTLTIICPTGLTYTGAAGTGTDPSTGLAYTAAYTYTYPSSNLDSSTFCPKAGTTPTATIPDGGFLVPAIGDVRTAADYGPNKLGTCNPAPGTYCGYYNMNVTIASGSTVTLTPQENGTLTGNNGDNTYLFVNSSLAVQSGATIQCLLYWLSNGNAPFQCQRGILPYPFLSNPWGSYGVTFVLTGGQVGTLTIASGANAYLYAPTTNSFDPSLNGILFYRRGGPSADESAAQPGVNISDTTSAVLLGGGMYFPDSYVSYTGNTFLGLAPDQARYQYYVPRCNIVVAAYLTLGFLSSDDSQPNPTQLENDQCSGSYGTPPLNVQAAKVVE